MATNRKRQARWVHIEGLLKAKTEKSILLLLDDSIDWEKERMDEPSRCTTDREVWFPISQLREPEPELDDVSRHEFFEALIPEWLAKKSGIADDGEAMDSDDD